MLLLFGNRDGKPLWYEEYICSQEHNWERGGGGQVVLLPQIAEPKGQQNQYFK